jgi:Cu-processing system permease protein
MIPLLHKELRDALRNRWLTGYAVVLGLLGLAAGWMGLDSAGGLALQVFGRTTAALTNLCLLLAPLVAVTLGAAAVAGERDRGTLELLLAQPITRGELLAAKYTGLLLALAAATALGFLPTGVAVAVGAGPAALARYLLFPLLALLLIAAMLALGLLISVRSPSGVAAQGRAIFTWFVFVLLYDLLLMGALVTGGLPAGVLAALLVANPVDAGRVLVVLALEPDLYLLGPAGALLVERLSPAGAAAALVAALLAWAAAPLAAALAAFRLRVPAAPRAAPTPHLNPTLDPRRGERPIMTMRPLLFLLLPLALPLAACQGNAASGTTTTALEEKPQTVVVTAAMLARGAATYKLNCVPCHGAQGRGDGPAAANLDPKPRNHTDRAYMDGLSDPQLATTIRFGGLPKGMPQMPSHPHIDDEELSALVAFVRSLSRGQEAVAGSEQGELIVSQAR